MTQSAPPSMQDRALQDLSFIRRTMEGATTFTDVSGLALVLVGAGALGTAALASRQPTIERWVALWVFAAVAASLVSGLLIRRKMLRRTQARATLTLPARRFFFAFWPCVVTGAAITAALVPDITRPHLAGIWLLLYGSGIMAAGAHSVRVVPLLGAVFLPLGFGALFLSRVSADVWMALGFGVAHLVAGVQIMRRHGG